MRRYLRAAAAAGTANADAVLGVLSHVTGVDVHPVAVTFARVTYLLAIGMDRLQARRPAARSPSRCTSATASSGATEKH